jgi:hypothetical protein
LQLEGYKSQNKVVMARLDRTIQKPLQRLKKTFNYRLEPILDPPVKPEDDENSSLLIFDSLIVPGDTMFERGVEIFFVRFFADFRNRGFSVLAGMILSGPFFLNIFPFHKC